MAIYINNKEITAVYIGKKAVTAIYKGSILIWEAALRIWKGKQIWKGKKKWKH